ncbi:hypothetical protein [Aliidiomarina quisquiliarum]|uniref:hypothetical protein n=1 Tax=Aliidiomarina quisquiliarum TaxID=2938947 RepID=UPI00208DF1E2|nr:hypothetical protein [Aliidiomarina quisquiliarum]MCO4321114.1 hypothetical protein [Aliidiomarina quisquiliarum]
MKAICTTGRLVIRCFNLSDTDFIIRLLNEESFIRCIGDKKVRTQEDALNYLTKGPLASYEAHGFGLNMVQLKKLGFSLTATIELYGSVNYLYEYGALVPYITSSSTNG